jgi:hypothetical protein
MFRGGPSYAGAAALELTTDGVGGSSATGVSSLTAADFLSCGLSFYSNASFSSTLMSWTFTWYASDGITVLGTSTGNKTVGIAYARFTATATKPLAATSYTLSFTNANASGRNVWVDSVTVSRQMSGGEIENGAVGNAQLDVITDVTKIQLATTPGGPRGIYDVGGVLRGQEYAYTDGLHYTGVKTGGQEVGIAIVGTLGDALSLSNAVGGTTSLVSSASTAINILAGSGADLLLAAHGKSMTFGSASVSLGSDLNVSGAIQTGAQGSIIVGNSALPTNATSGFLYIDSCAGAPTGIPASSTGTIPLVFDSTNSILYAYYGGAWRTLSGFTTPIKVSSNYTNSNTESAALFTGAIPVGALAQSRMVRARMFGTITNAGTGHTTTVRVKVAGTTIGTIAVATVSGVAGLPWFVELTFTVRTTGAGGTAWKYIESRFNNVLADVTGVATTALDTTAAADVTLTAQFSAASASDVFTLDQGVVEFIN